MLPAEIEPFAQAHINALDEVRLELIDLYNNSPDDSELTSELLNQLTYKLDNAKHALYRFRACMIDEHKQKERLHQAMLICRTTHK